MVPKVDRDRTLELFDRLADEVGEALEQLSDWGLSGDRPTQYRHDVIADDIILPSLLEEGFGVLSEESGLIGTERSEVVVVDPVDGSTNGSRGLPWYATSLCAVDEAGPVVALVANLATGERFRASRGEGFEVRPAASSKSADGLYTEGVRRSVCSSLSEAIVGFSGLPPRHGGWAQFRAMGAAALDMCAVAVGQLDGFVDVDRAHGVWDYLGAALVCSEAGATVGEIGREDLLTFDVDARRGPVVAATVELHQALMAMIEDWSVDDV